MTIRRALVDVTRGEPVWSLPKTAAGVRGVALDEDTVATLERVRAVQRRERLLWGPAYRDRGLVFAHEDGSPLHPERTSRAFRQAVDAALVPRIRLHDLRHGWATLALRAGVPVKVVQERLGHSSPVITLGIYAHVVPGMDREAAVTVAALLR